MPKGALPVTRVWIESATASLPKQRTVNSEASADSAEPESATVRGSSSTLADLRSERSDLGSGSDFGFLYSDFPADLTLRVPDLTRLPPVDLERTFGGLLTEQLAGVVSDHAQFYSAESLTWLAAGFAAGAVMANTEFDSSVVRHHYLRNVVNISNDDFYESIHQPHFLGDGRYTLPAFAIAAWSEPLIANWEYGAATSEWGQRSLRTVLVGAPAMLAAQLLTGGSRPDETTAKSRWQPLQDDNGVSGHSFMGAIPFLSAAKTTENRRLSAGLYVLSTAPAISRVNDDKHYFSQAFLGWWMAVISADAVDRSHRTGTNANWFVGPVGEGLGLGMTYEH